MIYSIQVLALFDSDDDEDAKRRFGQAVEAIEAHVFTVPTAVLTRGYDNFKVVAWKMGDELSSDLDEKDSNT